jgi:excisionase family DNA binding protein
MTRTTAFASERNGQRGGRVITVGGRSLIDGQFLAERLGVARTTVWRLAHSGRIGYYVIGRRWFFCESEVVEALRVPATVAGGAKSSPGCA